MMNRLSGALRGLGLALLGVALAACVQYPTERQSIVDLRPGISFQGVSAAGGLADARVLVDGLDVGRAGDFEDGVAAVRVTPGTHVVQVLHAGRVLLEERTYIGAGVRRSFVVR